jgi:hypothetical protein
MLADRDLQGSVPAGRPNLDVDEPCAAFPAREQHIVGSHHCLSGWGRFDDRFDLIPFRGRAEVQALVVADVRRWLCSHDGLW